MRAAEQIQLASLRHLFYRVGYGRIVSHSQVDRLPAFYSAIPTRDAEAPSDMTRIEWQGPSPR
jgi:hypothetical protein